MLIKTLKKKKWLYSLKRLLLSRKKVKQEESIVIDPNLPCQMGKVRSSRSGFNIRLSQEELRFLSLLEGLTGTLASDCVWEKDTKRVVFVVRRKDVGKIIGRGGTTIRRLRDYFQKQIDIVEYSDRLKEFVANTLAPVKITNVEIHEKSGKKTVVVTVNPKERGKAIGKNGRNIQRSRLLMKRHFRVNNVIIQSRS